MVILVLLYTLPRWLIRLPLLLFLVAIHESGTGGVSPRRNQDKELTKRVGEGQLGETEGCHQGEQIRARGQGGIGGGGVGGTVVQAMLDKQTRLTPHVLMTSLRPRSLYRDNDHCCLITGRSGAGLSRHTGTRRLVPR